MQILGTGTRDVEITAPLKIKCLQTTIEQAVVIGEAAPVEAVGLYVSNNAVINGGLTVVGNLTVNGFTATKPYVSLRINTSGGTPTTVVTVGGVTTTTIGTPGTMTVQNYGYTSSITSARGTVGAGNYLLYSFTWTTPHPYGANYAVMCNFQGSSTTNTSPNGFFRATGTATSMTVWVRTADGIIKDENFYVYTVP
jgi:hypothetical protein